MERNGNKTPASVAVFGKYKLVAAVSCLVRDKLAGNLNVILMTSRPKGQGLKIAGGDLDSTVLTSFYMER